MFGVGLSIDGLVTAMRWSDPAEKAGYDRSCMNVLYPLPSRSMASAS